MTEFWQSQDLSTALQLARMKKLFFGFATIILAGSPLQQSDGYQFSKTQLVAFGAPIRPHQIEKLIAFGAQIRPHQIEKSIAFGAPVTPHMNKSAIS
jgi:hypothetical protein